VKRFALAALLLFALLGVSGPAHAVLDPTRAQSDVDAAMRDKDLAFCRDPRQPMSPRAQSLCGHATEIPGCAGFQAACAKTAPPPRSPSWTPPTPPPTPLLAIPGMLGTLAQLLVWLLVAALVVAVLVPIILAIARMKRSKRPDAEAGKEEAKGEQQPAVVDLPAITDEDALLARAGELARRGENAAALQLYLAASLRALDKRGAVRLARDRTNGEYVRGCSDAGMKPPLRDIVREVDRVQFGGEQATQDAVARAAQRAVAIVRALPVMLVALALACLLGCGGGAASKVAPKFGDDPAGDELVKEVLRRQGVKAEVLETALATMPVPKPGERTPAVLVDLERTELDADTRDHLVEWVDAGGVLVLFGSPGAWPAKFGAAPTYSTGPHKITVRRLLARSTPAEGDEDDEPSSDPGDSAVYSRTTERGELASGEALGISKATDRVAWFDDGMTYAAVVTYGKGYVLGVASDELLLNAGLARPGNAAAMIAILSNADRVEMRLAEPDDGVSPPTSPIAAMTRAGLGVGLVHALVAALVLFFAVGVRLARPKPSPPPRRRAFSEHVEAVGALYARTRNAPHALGCYARFADERLRARMPRGAGDIPAFLASRARMPLDGCQRLWMRAVQAKAGAPPLGDELAVLRELSAVYAAAMAQDK
jgi:hypothetical protein